jgi:hypothetical protein
MLRKLTFVLFTSAAWAGSNAALIASLEGTVTIGKSKHAASHEWIPEGAVLETAANSKALVILLNGHRYEFGGRARATVGAAQLWNTSGPIHELAPLPPMPHPAPLAIETDAAAVTAFRGSGDIKWSCLRTGARMLPGNSTLSFQPVEGATSYQVAVENEAGETISDDRTQGPKISMNLPPGRRYSMRVKAWGPSGIIAQGTVEFATLSDQEVQARQSFATALSQPELLAEIDFENKLVCEAIGELQAAVKTNPSLAKRLQQMQTEPR